jgi:phage terminase small subunit
LKALQIAPEGLELANEYLTCGSIKDAAKSLCISTEKAVEVLNKAEVKRYIDAVYLDMGYRNRNKIAEVMDEIIESKLEEARESEMFSTKDLVDIMQIAHKMRMDEIKAEASKPTIQNQTNVQINETPFGQGNYGKLMEKLLGGLESKDIEV